MAWTKVCSCYHGTCPGRINQALIEVKKICSESPDLKEELQK